MCAVFYSILQKALEKIAEIKTARDSCSKSVDYLHMALVANFVQNISVCCIADVYSLLLYRDWMAIVSWGQAAANHATGCADEYATTECNDSSIMDRQAWRKVSFVTCFYSSLYMVLDILLTLHGIQR